MHITLDTFRRHARHCAEVEACTTAELAARALDCSPEAARTALKFAAESGYFRPLSVRGLGNKICYQPTPKAAGIRGANHPKFLRAGLAPAARWRGLLRGFARFAGRPELVYLSAAEQAVLCQHHGISERGHARALVGVDEQQREHIFIPLLKSDTPIAAIEAAADRWLPLLEPRATLHLVAAAGEAAEAVRTALCVLLPPLPIAALQDQLARVDAQMAGDPTGVAAVRLAAERAALNQKIITTPLPASDYYWLGELHEAAL